MRKFNGEKKKNTFHWREKNVAAHAINVRS